MKEKLSCEELQKHIAELEQKNATLERSIRKIENERDLKSKMLTVFRSAPQMMAISSLEDGKYVEVNNTFLQTLGYKREDIIGKSSDDIDLFADLVQSNKFIKKIAGLKKVQDFDVTVKTKSGSTLDLQFSAETILLGDNNYLLTSYSDPKLTSKVTSKGPTKLREMLMSLPNMVMVIVNDDNDLPVIEYINTNSREFSSVDPKLILGKRLADIDIKNLKVLQELVAKILISGEAHKETLLDFGKEDEGCYYGFRINTGEIFIIWEPGFIHRSRENDLLMQSDVFERFANMIPNVIFEINIKGKVTYANTEGLKMFGFTLEDIENGVTVRDIFKEDQLTSILENLKVIADKGESSSNEYTAYKKNGETIRVLAHTTGIYDLNGKLLGFRGILTNLSQKVSIQEKILKEKTELETLLESTPESIIQTTNEGIIERINAEFTRQFGFTEEECLGQNVNKLIIPESLKDEGSSFTSRASNNETISVDTYRRTKSGELIFVSLLIKPIRFNDKTTSLYAIYRNITDQRRNSDLKDVILNISNAALTQTEFHDMFSSFQTEIGKLWNTTNFYIALYNKENQTLSLPFYSDEKDRFDNIPIKGTLTGWLINNGKPNLLEIKDIEVLENKKEVDLVGTACKVWLGVPLIIDGKKIGAMVLQDYDEEKAFNLEDLRLLNLIGNQIALVIQRKEMMENLIIERRKAEDAARLKQQFMSTMSHEIRTPLNEVLGITNLLLQSKPREDQMEYIKTLRFSGNHLLTLVNDVLDFTKMESGMIVFEKTQFNFRDFMNELKRTYSFRTDEKGIELRIEYNNKLPVELIGDPIRLNQVMSNLISNAVKFTKEGYIKISVTELKRDKKSIDLLFSVEDTGIGIPEDKFDAIFENYTQASEDTTRIFGGTGLGLSIVKKLIELQESSIKVDSELNKGSTFTFSLSFAIAISNEDTSALLVNPDDISFDKLEGKRILIAEDNKINFFVVSKFLSKWGINVSHAINGKEAIDLIDKNEYDLILMDLHMPEMDGIEATKLLRESENEAIKDLPVIALTAAIMSEHEDKIKNLSFNDYILKPFKPKELYDKILRHSR